MGRGDSYHHRVSGSCEAFDLVHLHTVADWFNVPNWLETLPGGMGVVITLHDMWHFTGGCFYRGCDLLPETCAPCPILKTPLNRVLAKDEQRENYTPTEADAFNLLPTANGWQIWQTVVPSSGLRPRHSSWNRHRRVQTKRKAQCRAKLDIPGDVFVIAAGAASLTLTPTRTSPGC